MPFIRNRAKEKCPGVPLERIGMHMDLAAHPLPEVTVFSLDHPETQDTAKFGGPPEARFRRLAKRKVEKG